MPASTSITLEQGALGDEKDNYRRVVGARRSPDTEERGNSGIDASGKVIGVGVEGENPRVDRAVSSRGGEWGTLLAQYYCNALRPAVEFNGQVQVRDVTIRHMKHGAEIADRTCPEP